MRRRILAHKVLRQYQDILTTLAQRGYLKNHHCQAMIEVRAEMSLRHAHTQIRLRSSHELDVELATLHGAQAAHALLLNNTEEFGLEQHRQRLDLVQEQRAVCRTLHQAGLGTFGIREGAGLEAEQFHLQQRLWDGGTVDLDEGTVSPRTAVVDDAGNQPLARASLPLQQQRRDRGTPHRVEGGEVADLGAQGIDSGSMAHDAVCRMDGRDRA